MARATEDVDDFEGTVDIADDRPPPPPLSVARHLIDEPSRMAKFMIAGGVAGAVSRTATAPIDRLKLLLQVRRRRRRRRAGAGGHGIDDADRTRGPFFAVDLFFLPPASHLDSPSLNSTRLSLSQLNSTSFSAQVNDSAKPMTIRDGIRSMLREGTPRAFFRGNGANVLKIAPETALKLTFNDRIKRAVASGSPDPGASLSPAERFVAGAAAGALAQSVIYPLELIRTRLAICPKGTYRGIADAAARVFRNEGPKAFYRGLAPSLIGILPYAGVDIAAFETLKEALLDAYEPRGEPPPPAAIIAAGAASSSVAQFCSYPLALVRTRLQAQGAGGRPIKYDGMVDVIRKTVASEGVRGLYKGEKKKRRGGSNCVFFLRVPLFRPQPHSRLSPSPPPSLFLCVSTTFKQRRQQACSPTCSRWPPAPASPGSCSRRPRARWGWTERPEKKTELGGKGENGKRARRKKTKQPPLSLPFASPLPFLSYERISLAPKRSQVRQQSHKNTHTKIACKISSPLV